MGEIELEFNEPLKHTIFKNSFSTNPVSIGTFVNKTTSSNKDEYVFIFCSRIKNLSSS